MTRPAGYLSVVLHAHLPWIRHPEWDWSIEEEWFFEAVAECYRPLLDGFDGRAREGVVAPVTLSISPTLVAMFDDDLLRERYRTYVAQRQGLAERERTRLERDAPGLLPALEDLAAHYDRAAGALDDDLPARFAALHDAGRIELITTTATHGFSPLLADMPGAWELQVREGVAAFEHRFGRRPRGLWLPECGYLPGIERALGVSGVRFFFVDAHGLLTAEPPAPHAMYAPVFCPNGVAAFARDPESADRIWNASTGYPGDPAYREFHRDIGFDRPVDELAPVIAAGHLRRPTGFRYWRVTDRNGDHREPYDPAAACARARDHASEFVARCRREVDRLAPGFPERPPLLVAPFDAELFGHWWWEGPVFLDAVLRALPAAGLEAITPIDYLQRHPTNPVATPGPSSWGAGGHAQVWLNDQTDWIHAELTRIWTVARRLGDADALPAAARRELLLAQASDWPFLIRMGTSADYAESRVRGHIAAFDRLVSGDAGGQ